MGVDSDQSFIRKKAPVVKHVFIAIVALAAIAMGLAYCHSTESPHPVRMAFAGYFLSVVVEVPFLIFGLSGQHKMSEKIVAGLWLTACTYPFVAWVFPSFIHGSIELTVVREMFAALAECLLFWFVFIKLADSKRTSQLRDLSVVIFANVTSFLFGELLKYTGAIWTVLGWFELC